MLAFEAFKEKVQSMTAKEIILTMVESLENPVTKIEMGTYGMVNMKTNTCFGCAATNTICKIAEVDHKKLFELRGSYKNKFLHHVSEEFDFVMFFESAINGLRKGAIIDYNHFAIKIPIALIPEKEPPMLPCLNNHYTAKDLQAYKDFANTLNE